MSEDKKALAKSESAALEARSAEVTYYQPAVDVVETDEAITLYADLPGVDKDGVDIRIEKDVLTITGTVKDASEEGRPVYVEYKTGNFVRSFALTEDVDREKITAEMVRGVLKLAIPKSAKRKPKKITISGE